MHARVVLGVIASPELPKFADMLLENDVAFITPYHYSPCGKCS